jgi:hypothetical protein
LQDGYFIQLAKKYTYKRSRASDKLAESAFVVSVQENIQQLTVKG